MVQTEVIDQSCPYIPYNATIDANPLSNMRSKLIPKESVEPIAIIGLSFKFPGGNDTSASLWETLLEKRCTATEFPNDRLSASAVYHPDRSRKGAIPFRGGHFIDHDISRFDAPFFSISDTEAASLDPQQRGLLETTYRAFENAGLRLEKVSGSKTSVYTGCFTNDWQQLSLKDSDQCSNHTGLGIEASMNANRISWFFNLKGTSFNVDSACSSSLVSLDLACKSLATRDSDMSIAAGCNLIFYPDIMHALSNLSLLSPDNKCFSFDSRANGYARGEGFAVLVLKRLSDAIADNNTIRAVIRSTGSNQDGYTPGITQPSGEAQAKLIRETYEKAGLSLDDTRFFEAHGTGTEIGDPIEASAIGEVFRHSRPLDEPLYVGALKSNIGHLEGASGLAGIIKTVLALESGIIPPNTNFMEANPRIDTEFLRIKFPLEPIMWPSKGLRRASVNSFGFGGTNAHVIMDDTLHYIESRGLIANHNTVAYPSNIQESESIALPPVNGGDGYLTQDIDPKLLTFSATDQDSLKEQVESYAKFFDRKLQTLSPGIQYLDSLAYTLNFGRSDLAWRSSVLVNNKHDLVNIQSKIAPPQRATVNPKLCFIFTGQGAQYPAEILRSLQRFDVFDKRLAEAEDFLLELGCSWKLRDELFKCEATSNINNAEFSQPICTAVQVALIDLLKSFRIHSLVVIGHSSGEIAAAYCIGAISAKSAWQIAYFRGVHSSQLAYSTNEKGGMMSVGLSKDEVQPYLDRVAAQFDGSMLSIACVNSQKNVTVSGPCGQIDVLGKLLNEDRVFARKLVVDMAYHSPAMNAAAPHYCQSIKNIEKGTPPAHLVTMISTVTGKWVKEEELCKPEYWVDNMVSPVRFCDALKGLSLQSGKAFRKKLDCSHRNHLKITFLLEIGFHSALKGPIREIISDVASNANIGYASVLIRGQPPLSTICNSVAELYCHGYKADISRVNRLGEGFGRIPRLLCDLPEYQFNHKHRYWEEGRISKRLRLHPQNKLDLLGRPTPDWNPYEAKWRNFIRVSEMSWVEDHKINGSTIYPAAGMLVMALEAANQMVDPHQNVTGFAFKDVLFQQALGIPPGSRGIETHLHIRRVQDTSSTIDSWCEFRLFSYDRDEWRENCRGFIRVDYNANASKEITGQDEAIEELKKYQDVDQQFSQSEHNVQFQSSKLYEKLWECGFEFGQAFQRLENGSFNAAHEAQADVSIYQWPEKEFPQSHIIHPCTLDGILHLSVAAHAEGGEASIPTAVPSSLKRLWIAKAGLSFPESKYIKATARMRHQDNRGTSFDISVLDEGKNRVLVQVEDLKSTIISEFESPSDSIVKKQICYHLDWKPDLDTMRPHQLSQYCSEARHQEAEPIEFYQELTFVLIAFLKRAIDVIGPVNPPKTTHHLTKYLDWARIQLDRYRNGDLPYTNPDWELFFDSDEVFEKVCYRVETTNDFGRAFVETGRNLIPILRGQIDPLELLFNTDLLKNLYREVNNSRNCFPEFTRYLDALGHKNPNLRILEIGAGTGGTTAKILSTLSAHDDSVTGKPRYASYHYTDISPSFFEQAKEEFAQYPNIVYKVLDIEQDPCAQGYESENFDLIIAANVLHATTDINATMQNVRKLLKSGTGVLMMYEFTRPDILRTAFIMGLLPGWWLSSEFDRRWSPVLTTASWSKLLRRQGFTGIELELPDYIDPGCQEGSIIVTKAVQNYIKPPSSCKIVVVATPNSFQHEIAVRLRPLLLASQPNSKYNIISWKDANEFPDRSNCYFIFLEELHHPFMDNLTETAYCSVKEILTSSKGSLWVSNGGGLAPSNPECGIINGLSRVLRNENPSRPCATLALDYKDTLTDKQLETVCHIFERTQFSTESSEQDMEFLEVNGYLSIPRVLQTKELTQEIFSRSLPMQTCVKAVKDCPPVKLAIESAGFLDKLHFIQDDDVQTPMEGDEVEVEVRAIGMNFRDCLVALGRVPGTTFGSECAGIVTKVGYQIYGLKIGDRVAMSATETFKTFVRVKAAQVLKIKDDMTFTEAATLPTQFGTAWQAVHKIARLQRGESILIHAGAGGTGQAAIQVAQYIGAEVFATVGSNEKKNILIAEYNIPQDHIFYSRDTSFAKGIMRVTNGRGVDVILNSLAGESLIASWECIAPYGRFIEIGKKDILANSSLPMYSFRKNVSFICFDGFTWQLDRPQEARRCFENVFNLYAEGKFNTARPLHVFSLEKIEDAFRLMQSGKTAGKIVLEVSPETNLKTTLATRPSFEINSDGTYVVAGGLGGLGRSVSRWLIERGAKNLILLSRSGMRNEASREFVEGLRHRGVTVQARTCDVTDKASLRSVLEKYAKEMPPVKGCIQGSMVLRDAIFDTMSYEDWRLGTDCKTIGSWNLHDLLPKDLDFFLLLSSASGVVGLRGQANYAAGNTYMDALARYRVAHGQRAISLDLGALVDDGLLAENPTLLNRVLAYGALNPISREQFFAVMDYYCDPHRPLLTPQKSQAIIGLGLGSGPGLDGIVMSRQAIFRHLNEEYDDQKVESSTDEEQRNWKDMFSAATSLIDATEISAQALIAKLQRTLSTLHGEVDMNKPLAMYGVDSLLAVELRSWIGREFLAEVALFDISGASNLSTLSTLVAVRSRIKHAPWAA